MGRIAKSFFLPFLAPIPLVLYALLPEIAGWDPEVELGETVNVIIWVILIGFVIVMSILPFKGAFGSFFGTKESKRIQAFGREATATVQAIGENPDKIIIDWRRGSSGEAPEAPSAGNTWSEADRQLVEREGIDGTAKYLSLEDTGRSKDFNPVVRATIEVSPKGGETYTFKKDVPLPTNIIGVIRSKIGKSFPARIHPNDGTKVSIHIVP